VLIKRLDRAVWPFAMALSIAGITRLAFPFDGLYGQDGFAYFRFARAIWPHLLRGAPWPDLYWPRGYPAAVAGLLPLTGDGPLAGQIVSTLACAWAATATFLLVKELERMRGAATDPTAAVVAGICVAASGAVLRTSQVVMADGLALGLAATTLWCAARHLRERRGAWLVPCAIALGWGAVTRWQVGLLVLPLGAAWAIARRGHTSPADPAHREASAIRAWWVVASLAGLLVLVPQLVVAHGTPNSPERHEWFQMWTPLNAVRRDFYTSEGHARYHFPVAVFYLLRFGWPDWLFPTVAALGVVGACSIIRQGRAVEITLLIGWPLVTWAFISGIPYENPRFLLPTLPAIGALAGIGFRTVRDHQPAGRRSGLAWWLAASIAAGLAFGAREHAHTVARKEADRALVDWIDAHVPAGTTLLRSGGTLMSEYYGSTKIRDTYLFAPAELDAVLSRECPCFYLEDPKGLESRSAGLPVQARFEALQRSPGLTPVATRPPLTLFRVGPAR
jgi:hypothetical protein